MSTRTLKHRPKKWSVTTHNGSVIYHGRYKTIAHIVAAWHWLFSSTNIKIINY